MIRVPTALANSEKAVRRLVIFVLLYCILAFQAMLPIDDPDIWWRLRTGEWIVENHWAPFKDYFSAYAMGARWLEYSWLFSLLVYALHQQFGLTGLVYFVVSMALIIAFVVHQLVRRFSLPLLAEATLLALALAAMKPEMTPRPWLFTILFFSIELWIILHVRRSGNDGLLWVLPFLFALWANLHIQFVYGVAILGLLLAEALVVTCSAWFGYKINAPPISAGRIILVIAACLFASLLTPYHYLLFRQIFDYVGQTGIFQNISELHPMLFRSPGDWIVLFLTLSAAFALGWQKRWLPFYTFSLLMGAFLGFRARRDAWVLALVAIVIIGDTFRSLPYGSPFQLSKRQIAIGIAATTLALYLASLGRHISEEHLQAVVENTFPVRAVEYVRANQLSGPLFNHLDWGGFLIWSLREIPVGLDGRLNLFGDERIARSLSTWQARQGWDHDPDLLKARLVIADKGRPLTSLLRIHTRYEIVYEDNTALVFVPVK